MSVFPAWGPRVAAVAVVALAVTGCGGQDIETAGGPVALERIGEAVGCTPQLQTDVQELRQGACTTALGAYVMLTFASEAGQKSWLEEAEPYGGSYLIGERWVVEADPEALEPVREKLGGRVEEGAHHGHSATSPSGPSSSATPMNR
ncbi:hypothetical protein [Actinacidiphila sp. bgisy160]|uniref:hypothetical protein n=1 Tax=Actinacidiphila sp. bgisy160 TaxID=3413796 RepID=UPI003D7634DF